jgi:hypothetical protein
MTMNSYIIERKLETLVQLIAAKTVPALIYPSREKSELVLGDQTLTLKPPSHFELLTGQIAVALVQQGDIKNVPMLADKAVQIAEAVVQKSYDRIQAANEEFTKRLKDPLKEIVDLAETDEAAALELLNAKLKEYE